jgi:hypothetical protein
MRIGDLALRRGPILAELRFLLTLLGTVDQEDAQPDEQQEEETPT